MWNQDLCSSLSEVPWVLCTFAASLPLISALRCGLLLTGGVVSIPRVTYAGFGGDVLSYDLLLFRKVQCPFCGHLSRCHETRSPPGHVKGRGTWLMDVSGDQGALPALLPTCVWQTTSQLTRVCSPPSPCSLLEATSTAGEKKMLHTAQCSTCIFVCQKAWCRCPENVEFLNRSLCFKMSSKPKLTQKVILTTQNIYICRGCTLHYLFSLSVSNTSESKMCCQVMYSDDLWTSPFPRKMNLGVRAWFLINTLTSKMMVKGSATYLFFCSKGKYSDSCVRRNMLTQDSLYSLQWPPKPLPDGGHLMTINYSCTHTVCVLMQVGINMFGLMKTWICDFKAMLES